MEWFEAASGFRTLEKMADVVSGGELCPGLPAGRRQELIGELQDCIEQLRPAAERHQKFHLAVIV